MKTDIEYLRSLERDLQQAATRETVDAGRAAAPRRRRSVGSAGERSPPA